MSLIHETGNFPTYRFYITILPNTVMYEVFPLNFLATSLVDELEKGLPFYRRKFSGSLLFGTNSEVLDDDGVTQNRMDDWALFWAIESSDVYRCEKISLIITKTVNTVTDVYYEGYFSVTDGTFDIDKCTFEVTPTVDDEYTDILNKADIQHNLIVDSSHVHIHAYLAGFIDVDYGRNKWLARIGSNSVLEYLANDAINGIVPGCTVSSTFFTAVNNPVTGATNHLRYLTIAQKSDIIRPASSNPATSFLLSWNELMDILWTMFQVTWNYDSATDTINVEHISWFYSITDGYDLRNDPMTQGTNKYTYLKEQMPKYEKFSWMEADNIDFIGVPIEYDSLCVNQDPESNTIEKTIPVTTDLEYIYNNSATASPAVEGVISDDGFVILCTDGTHVEAEGGVYFGSWKLNMHLSWANLHHRYFKYNRVLIEGHMNGVDTDFWTALKTKKQECSTIICGEYDPSDRITTELGTTYLGGAKAQVKNSKLNPSGEINFTLLYGPPDNAALIAAGVPDYAGGIPAAPVATGYNVESATSVECLWTILGAGGGYYLDVATDTPPTTFLTGYHNKDVGFTDGWIVEGLDLAGTVYYFWVRNYDEGGVSGYSNIITIDET